MMKTLFFITASVLIGVLKNAEGSEGQFRLCGANGYNGMMKKWGFLGTFHPYKPGRACKWMIRGPPGSKVFLRLLKMDIQSNCLSDCPDDQNSGCAWDYLQLEITKPGGKKRTPKMCGYVNKFSKFTDYSNWFQNSTYLSDPMFYNVVKYGWFKGIVVHSNEVAVYFKSDEKANFFGFDLAYRFSKPGGNCVDTDNGATDVDGYSCEIYTQYPQDCGLYDDGDFRSNKMCCACKDIQESRIFPE